MYIRIKTSRQLPYHFLRSISIKIICSTTWLGCHKCTKKQIDHNIIINHAINIHKNIELMITYRKTVTNENTVPSLQVFSSNRLRGILWKLCAI